MLKSYLAREIPLQFEIAVIHLEAVEALLHLGQERRVMLFLQQFLAGQEVVVLLLKMADQGLGVLQPGKLGSGFLGGLGIVPEVGLGGLSL